MKSLELNWIRKYDKSLVIPEVVFIEASDYGGIYYEPEKQEVMIGDKFYDLTFGLIGIATDSPSIESTIAHEWRHHWQALNGWKYDGVGWDANTPNYEESICEYFTKSKAEFDALRFEIKHCKSDLTEEWLKVLCDYGVNYKSLVN